ncbi:secreted immunoglobulin domain 1 [Fundulus heteroclitus]|uniref:secreted immunoglobulin domain 1 n=1 Tax=Fundulus heteroclitus TaxID=8078 RepID=UPI00165AC902|nr:secreted immunoglobulin domain 1 [Fundulus heteroclitus]
MEMKAVQVSVVLLFALSGVQQQAAALPASTLLVRVGEDATLQCPLLDASNGTGPATLSWYRKATGHGPTLLVSISPANGSTLRYGDGVSPDKVSAAANGSLLLRGSEQSDSAVYYCGVSNGSEHGKDPKAIKPRWF